MSVLLSCYRYRGFSGTPGSSSVTTTAIPGTRNNMFRTSVQFVDSPYIAILFYPDTHRGCCCVLR